MRMSYGGILDVVVGVDVAADMASQRALRLADRRGSLGVGPQVVAEDERVALVESPLDADVDVRRPLTGRRLDHALLEVVVGQVHAGRHVVARVFGDVDEAGARQQRHRGVEIEHADLNVNHVLGRQAGNGRRADVVDAECRVAERRPQPPPDCRELARPSVLVGDDLDHASERRELTSSSCRRPPWCRPSASCRHSWSRVPCRALGCLLGWIER